VEVNSSGAAAPPCWASNHRAGKLLRAEEDEVCSSCSYFFRNRLEREKERIFVLEKERKLKNEKTGGYVAFISKGEPICFAWTGLVPFGSFPFILYPPIFVLFWFCGCDLFPILILYTLVHGITVQLQD